MPGRRAVQHLQMPQPLGLTRQANAPQLPGGGGGWAQVELTDSLNKGTEAPFHHKNKKNI